MSGPEDALAILFDVLVPGDHAWPSASAAIADLSVVALDLSDTDRTWLARAAAHVAVTPALSRVAAVASLEGRDPAPFGRMLRSLYQAYYATEAAHTEVVRLADAGPREPISTFDPSLLAQVLRTQAGRRRL